ncbi:hypothetical protein VTN49DRAFT_5142 [Thermomyces lanuginosus]|uniref:uncharacterized protein n=1 Tax=Thermomyces lanuginosus TaxID=5541 RepID=UPI00374266C8
MTVEAVLRTHITGDDSTARQGAGDNSAGHVRGNSAGTIDQNVEIRLASIVTLRSSRERSVPAGVPTQLTGVCLQLGGCTAVT